MNHVGRSEVVELFVLKITRLLLKSHSIPIITNVNTRIKNNANYCYLLKRINVKTNITFINSILLFVIYNFYYSNKSILFIFTFSIYLIKISLLSYRFSSI